MSEIKLPTQKLMLNAFKLSIKEDKPIMLDYWEDSNNENIFIGVKDLMTKDITKRYSYIEYILIANIMVFVLTPYTN